MKYLVDTHTHTIASGHAYNTIDEMTRHAGEIGLKSIAITEHAPEMPGTCQLFYFNNLHVVPRDKFGVHRLMGTEANIINHDGKIDLGPETLKNLDIVIASFHTPCIKPGTVEENTAALLKVMDNPFVNIIGHPDDSRYAVDMQQVVSGVKKSHTLLELNNTSLKPHGPRKGARENDLRMLELCKKNNVCITLGSDAHVEEDIANFKYAQVLLDMVDFPDRLIANTDLDLLDSYLSKAR